MRGFVTILFKELIQFFRSIGLVGALLFFFLVDVYIVGNDIDIEPKNVTVGYVDYTSGYLSQKILSHLHSPQFDRPIPFPSQKELFEAIKAKKIVIGLIFDPDFEKSYFQKGQTTLNALVDSTAAAQSLVTLTYLRSILWQMADIELPIELKIHKLFNQNADTRKFMPLAELLSLMTLFGVILSAAVFVKEKEQGTWDLMLLSPVDSKVIIFAKVTSQVLILFAMTLISLGIDLFGIFDVPLNGSFIAFCILTILFLYSISGIGLFVAAVSNTIMEVAQWAVFIMMPIIFLSGAWTPIYSMGTIVQDLSYLSPLRYYIEGVESILFRGSPVQDLLGYALALFTIGGVLFYIGYRKIGRLF